MDFWHLFFQQLQSAESDLDSQTKLVLTLQDSLDATRKGQDAEKEVNVLLTAVSENVRI